MAEHKAAIAGHVVLPEDGPWQTRKCGAQCRGEGHEMTQMTPEGILYAAPRGPTD